MGGNAFPHLLISRIRRESIAETLKYVTDKLNYPRLTYHYALNNLMGSALKQPDSGDLDIALNNVKRRPFDDIDVSYFDLRLFLFHCEKAIGRDYVHSKTFNSGQIQTAWPIKGDKDLGFVQIDFVSGDPCWLKFSHWSPGSDISPWKGVLISTMLGVLAKHKLDFQLIKEDKQIAKVGLIYDIEKGLQRRWFLCLRNQLRPTQVDPDYFESRITTCERYIRLGYITDPMVALRLIFGVDLLTSEIDSFEKLMAATRLYFSNDLPILKKKFLIAFKHSAGVSSYNIEDIENSEIWHR
jgi:hypothetical protein